MRQQAKGKLIGIMLRVRGKFNSYFLRTGNYVQDVLDLKDPCNVI